MTEFISFSSFFCITLTLVIFAFASALQQKFKLALLNPILISSLLVVAALFILDIPNETYQAGCQMLTYLMTPATICLSISFYIQYQNLKQHLWCVLAGVIAGTVCSIGSVYLLCMFFGLDRVLLLSLLPKSVTSAIGAALSEELGGIAAISTAVIILSGIVGNIAGPLMCRLFRIRDEIAQGTAYGTASHVIGTARATQVSQLTGAVSSLSLTIAGIVTCVLLSFLAQFL